MASISNKYMIEGFQTIDEKLDFIDSKRTALNYSMRINLDPLLMLEKSKYTEIPVLYSKEGKA
jgi:hypothetical protein